MNYRFYSEKVKEKTIRQLQDAMAKGQVTSEELIWACLERIACLDHDGPNLRSILELNPDALQQAELRDAQRRHGKVLGPLHGIPVVLKDSIDTCEKMHTTNGCWALSGHYARKDAFVVKQLRQAGAIVLAKNNMSEWYSFLGEGTPNGYSNRGGQTRNAYGAQWIPGGSSGGTAVAVSADFATVGIGTETAGSIIEPAGMNSVVGFKPTPGVISRSGCTPMTFFQDTPGPIARSVEDIAIVMNVLCAADEEDPAHWRAQELQDVDFTQDLCTEELENKRIGIVRGAFFVDMDQEAQAVVNRAIFAMREAGAQIVDPVENCLAEQILSHPEKHPERTNIDVLYHEFKVRLDHYLGMLESDSPVHSLKELLELNRQNPEWIRYGQSYLEAVEKIKDPMASMQFVNARLNDKDVFFERGIKRAMEVHGLDALVFPSLCAQGVAARAGCPSIIVPAGFSSQSGPVGLNFAAMPMEDPKLIRIAYAFEKKVAARIPPQIGC